MNRSYDFPLASPHSHPSLHIRTHTHTHTNTQLFFYIFHWIKGSPDNFSQGEFNGLTLWEQIDDGIPWTKTKKVFFLVPTALLFAASYITDYSFEHLTYNAPVYIILAILPKIPEMHRVRLFGINSTVGIDDNPQGEDDPVSTNVIEASPGRRGVKGGSKKRR